MTVSGRTPIYGPERWTTKRGTLWSYWDLWFCLVALADHAGDLDALIEAIENGGRMLAGGTVESKLSQAHPTSTKPPVTITSKSAIADDRLGGAQWHVRPLLALPHAPLPHRPDAGNTLPNAPFRPEHQRPGRRRRWLLTRASDSEVRLQVAADRAGSKHIGGSPNRGKGGPASPR